MMCYELCAGSVGKRGLMVHTAQDMSNVVRESVARSKRVRWCGMLPQQSCSPLLQTKSLTMRIANTELLANNALLLLAPAGSTGKNKRTSFTC